MTDDHKTYKSTSVELFGTKYEVSNKSSSSINNKFLLCLGFIKYTFIKFYKNIITPVINYLSNFIDWNFLMDIGIILLMCSGYIAVLCLFFTFPEINSRVINCGDTCEIYINHCVGYDGDRMECIRNNIYYYQVFLELFIGIIKWGIVIIFYFAIGCIIGAIIGSIISAFCFLIYEIFNKIAYQIKKINEQIPHYEEV